MVLTYNGSNHFNAAGKKVRFLLSNNPPDDPQLLPVKIETRGLMTHNTFQYNVRLTSHLMTHCFSIINVEDQTYDPHTIFFSES